MSDFATSEAGVQNAISTIRDKKDALEASANKITAAFNTATETIQLAWLNRMITNSWNGDGLKFVEAGKATMNAMMKAVEETEQTSQDISQG